MVSPIRSLTIYGQDGTNLMWICLPPGSTKSDQVHISPPPPPPDIKAWKVDVLSLPWENLDSYAFPPVAILGQVVTKMLDHGRRRMILITPGWLNTPWFWVLVNLSVQMPHSLPILEKMANSAIQQVSTQGLKEPVP